MSDQVKASVLHGPKDLRLVQIAVGSTGLCGSDLHYFNHFRNGDILVREPLTLGHESSGTVVAVGPGVADLAPGHRVALEVGLPCETCELCLAGRYNICRAMRFRSSAKASPHEQGTLQERINHPARWCHRLPAHISLDLGALLEPLSVALHASRRAGLPIPEAGLSSSSSSSSSPSATVLVFGAGTVGLLCAAVSKALGVRAVVIADIQGDRVDFAVANGFADAGFVVPLARPQTLDEKLAYAQQVADMAKGTLVGDGPEQQQPVGEVSVVYECTGVESCLQSAIYATKPGGKVVLIGMGTPVLTLPMSAAALREVDLVGVFRYADTYPAAIEMLSNRPPGLPDLEKLVTHRFKGMDGIQHAFDMAGKVKDGEGNLVLKVVVDMS